MFQNDKTERVSEWVTVFKWELRSAGLGESGGNCSDYSLCFLFTLWCHNSTVLPSKTVNRDPIMTLFSQHYLSYTQTVSVSHILYIPALQVVHICISSNKSTCHLLDRKKWGSKIWTYYIFTYCKFGYTLSRFLHLHVCIFGYRPRLWVGLTQVIQIHTNSPKHEIVTSLLSKQVCVRKLEWNIINLHVLCYSVTSLLLQILCLSSIIWVWLYISRCSLSHVRFTCCSREVFNRRDSAWITQRLQLITRAFKLINCEQGAAGKED